MITYIKRYSLLVLTLTAMVVLAGCKEDDEPTTTQRDLAPVTQALVDNSELVSTVFWDTTFVVASGVEETDIHYLSMKGLAMHLFVLKVDLNQEGVTPVTRGLFFGGMTNR